MILGLRINISNPLLALLTCATNGLIEFTTAMVGFEIHKSYDPTGEQPVSYAAERLPRMSKRWNVFRWIANCYLNAMFLFMTLTTLSIVLSCFILHQLIGAHSKRSEQSAWKVLEGPTRQYLSIWLEGGELECQESTGHFCMSLYMVYCLCHIPRFLFERFHYLDCKFVRYLLEPDREIQRFDRRLERVVKKLLCSVDMYREQMRRQDYIKNRPHVMSESQVVTLIETCNTYRRKLLDYKRMSKHDERLPSLRPSLFSLKPEDKIVILMRILICCYYCYRLLELSEIVQTIDLMISRAERCQSNRCKLNKYLFALYGASCLTTVFFAFNSTIILIMIESLGKLHLAYDEQGSLNKFLRSLQRANELQTGELAQISRDLSVECLVRTMLIEEEFSNGIQTISNLMSLNLLGPSGMYLWNTLTMERDQADYLVTILMDLPQYNVAAALVCLASSHLIRQGGKYWNILAEKRINLEIESNLQEDSERLPPDELALDFFYNSWKRRTFAHNHLSENFVARPMGVEMTVGKVIWWNFRIISMILLCINYLDLKAITVWFR